MTMRPIHSADAGPAAELVQTVRDRPSDGIDPFPPSGEWEVLTDMGARGKTPERCAHVAVEVDRIAGYGAVDYAGDMRRAVLVGPVVHPAARRNGHGRALLERAIEQARAGKQREMGIAVRTENGAAMALLESVGFRRKGSRVCMRVERREQMPVFSMKGITVRQATDEDAAQFVRFTSGRVPRTPKQTRSFLKSDAYVVLLALMKNNVVGFAEIDLRHGPVATLEQVDGESARIRKGLGNMLVAEAMREAFQRDGITHFDLLVPGNNKAQIDSFQASGLERHHEFVTYELKL